MTLQNICPCDNNNLYYPENSNIYANGPREIGENNNGYPKRLLGGADSLGILYKDHNQVLFQKQIRLVDFSRVPKYNFPIPNIKL